MMDYKYAYLLGNLLILLPIWLFLYIKRKDLRGQILVMSLLAGCLGPISEIWYLKDYWQPQTFNGWPIGIEDFLFGFFAGGIASTIYEELFRRRHSKIRSKKHRWHILTWSLLGVGFIAFNIFTSGLGINSIYASIIIFLVLSVILILFRPDLALSSITSGVLFAVIFFLSYFFYLNFYPLVFTNWWMLEKLSGLTVASVPIEELFWALGFGIIAGPIYEFYSGMKLKQIKS